MTQKFVQEGNTLLVIVIIMKFYWYCDLYWINRHRLSVIFISETASEIAAKLDTPDDWSASQDMLPHYVIESRKQTGSSPISYTKRLQNQHTSKCPSLKFTVIYFI